MKLVSFSKNMGRALQQAARAWVDDKAPMFGAAIAYYAMISLSPLLLIAIAIGGAVFGPQAASGEIVDQIGGLIGDTSARMIQSLIVHAHAPGQGLGASVVGGVTLLVGACGVFVQLQEALNTIWQVRTKPGIGWWPLLRKYGLSFTMVLGAGFLLLISLVVSAALSALGRFLSELFPEYVLAGNLISFLVPLLVITLIFALLLRFLPDVVLTWREVWGGAFLTAILFTVGKTAIGFYLGHSGISSAYGAAGSLVVILIWVYYSTQILLFGAEFVKCYKRQLGRQIVPEPHAELFRQMPVHPSEDEKAA